MKWRQWLKKSILIAGDIAFLYLAFCLAIYFRFSFHFQEQVFYLGLIPFSFVFITWLIVFSVNHLYELENAKVNWRFVSYFLKAVAINALLAAAIFYFGNWFGFNPKIILFLVIIIAFLLLLIWRLIFNLILGKIPALNVVFLGSNQETEELISYLKNNPHLGYEISGHFPAISDSDFKSMIETNKFKRNLLVTAIKLPNLETIYPFLNQTGGQLIKLSDFYERIFYRVPVSLIDDNWFIENVENKQNPYYQLLKRLFDLFFSSFLILLALPFCFLIALLIKIDSSGPVFYTSWRLGKNLKLFKIFKFRTMVKNADQLGPAWTLKSDLRITRIGKFLRRFHLDELPQLINIFLGQMSFVGPRPVEKKLADEFNQKIKYYALRHLIKPGAIGWAQLNHRYSASLEDDIKKLEYDLYYLKYGNLWFDLVIIFKALRIPFEVESQ